MKKRCCLQRKAIPRGTLRRYADSEAEDTAPERDGPCACFLSLWLVPLPSRRSTRPSYPSRTYDLSIALISLYFHNFDQVPYALGHTTLPAAKYLQRISSCLCGYLVSFLHAMHGTVKIGRAQYRKEAAKRCVRAHQILSLIAYRLTRGAKHHPGDIRQTTNAPPPQYNTHFNTGYLSFLNFIVPHARLKHPCPTCMPYMPATYDSPHPENRTASHSYYHYHPLFSILIPSIKTSFLLHLLRTLRNRVSPLAPSQPHGSTGPIATSAGIQIQKRIATCLMPIWRVLCGGTL